MSQNVTTGWPNAYSMIYPTMLRYVALSHAVIVMPGILLYTTAEEIILQGSVTLLAMQQNQQPY